MNVGFTYGEASSCGLEDKAKIPAAAHLSNLFFLQFDLVRSQSLDLFDKTMF